MALPLEKEVYNYPEHDIEITLIHRHGDIAMIFMHQYIANIILQWNGKYILTKYDHYNNS